MTAFTVADLPEITIKATPITERRMLVGIVSKNMKLDELADLWKIETLGSTFKPVTVFMDPNGRGIYLTFLVNLWERLALKKFSTGIYRGTNLLDYLETTNSAFGKIIEDPSDSTCLLA